MKNIIAGVVTVVIVAGAFYLGTQYDWNETEGPAENIGSAIDEGLSDAGRAVEDAVE